MLPIIALVGHQNVGKSTLFNRLTCTRDALVADFPGLTRDRKYGCARISNRWFICIDTGGINKVEDGLEKCMMEQSLLAIKEADIVLFIVDAHTGLVPVDFVIAKQLHLCEKNTFLIVNKIDTIDVNQIIFDFWSLGFNKIYPISASNGHGVTRMLKTMLLPFFEKVYPLQKKISKDSELKSYLNQQNLPIKLAIVGRPNVGKSTLTNCILGEKRMVVYDTPGTTSDSIHIPTKRNGYEYILIDTAGVRKRNKVNSVIEKCLIINSLQEIENANVVLLVIDAHEGISDQDLSLLNFIVNNGRSLVIVVNKWDNLSNEVRKQVKESLYYRLDFINFARIHFISALYGNGIDNMLSSVHEAYENSIRHRSTATLTRIINMAVKNHQPPLVRGRRVKFKYAHSGGYNPLIIVIHGNQVKDLSESYKRYLINYFRNSLHIIGTPIRISFKEGINPFINKK